ncbi:MAG: redoxin family protein [Patescibacteria group bacterium]
MSEKFFKKNSLGLIIGAVGIIALVASLAINSANKNQGNGLVKGETGVNAPAAPGDDMSSHHSAPAARGSIDNLVGQPSPSFSLTDREGKVYSSENLRGKNVVLFFNEGLMCYPACWNQIVSFAKDERFSKKDDLVVLSVIVDSKNEWQKAIDKMPELGLATVVFDEGAVFSGTLGVLKLPSSMHYGSLPGHTYVVIDKEGVIRHVFDDPNMAIHNDQLVKEIAKIN